MRKERENHTRQARSRFSLSRAFGNANYVCHKLASQGRAVARGGIKTLVACKVILPCSQQSGGGGGGGG